MITSTIPTPAVKLTADQIEAEGLRRDGIILPPLEETPACPAALDWPAWTDRYTWTPTDPDALNRENSATAADEMTVRVAAEVITLPVDAETFEQLLDMAERAGFCGDDLPEVTGLDVDRAEELARVWADGRHQRVRDEEEMAQDRYGRGVVLV